MKYNEEGNLGRKHLMYSLVRSKCVEMNYLQTGMDGLSEQVWQLYQWKNSDSEVD